MTARLPRFQWDVANLNTGVFDCPALLVAPCRTVRVFRFLYIPHVVLVLLVEGGRYGEDHLHGAEVVDAGGRRDHEQISGLHGRWLVVEHERALAANDVVHIGALLVVELLEVPFLDRHVHDVGGRDTLAVHGEVDAMLVELIGIFSGKCVSHAYGASHWVQNSRNLGVRQFRSSCFLILALGQVGEVHDLYDAGGQVQGLSIGEINAEFPGVDCLERGDFSGVGDGEVEVSGHGVCLRVDSLSLPRPATEVASQENPLDDTFLLLLTFAI